MNKANGKGLRGLHADFACLGITHNKGITCTLVVKEVLAFLNVCRQCHVTAYDIELFASAFSQDHHVNGLVGVGIDLGIGLGHLILHIVGCCVHHALRPCLLLVVVNDGCNLFIIPLAGFCASVVKHNIDSVHRRRAGYPLYILLREELTKLCLCLVSLIYNKLLIVRLLGLMALLVALVYAVREKTLLTLEVLTTAHVGHHAHIVASHLQEVAGIVHHGGLLNIVHVAVDDGLQQLAQVLIVTVVYLLAYHLPVILTEHDTGIGICHVGSVLVCVVASGIVACMHKPWGLHQSYTEHHASPNVELVLRIEDGFVKILAVRVGTEIVVAYEDSV